MGSRAKRQAAVNAQRTVASVKREMGTDWTFRVDEDRYNPQTISAMILRKLRTDA